MAGGMFSVDKAFSDRHLQWGQSGDCPLLPRGPHLQVRRQNSWPFRCHNSDLSDIQSIQVLLLYAALKKSFSVCTQGSISYLSIETRFLTLVLSSSGSLRLSLTLSGSYLWLWLWDLSQELTLNLVCHSPPPTKLFLIGFKWRQSITVWLLTISNWSWHSRWHSGRHSGSLSASLRLLLWLNSFELDS